MKRQSLIFSLIFIFTFLATAKDFDDQQPQVEVKNEIVEKIYRNAVRRSDVDSKSGKAGLNYIAGGAFFEPSEMKLSNTYYDVEYSKYWNSISMLTMMMENSFFEKSNILIKGIAGFSYSYQEKILQVKLKKAISNSERTTFLRFHSMPIIAGINIDYRRWIDFTPFVSARLGTQWIYQMSVLDGLEQGFWVPFYQFGFGINFFEPDSILDPTWLGGFNLSILGQQSISPTQTVKGLSTNLGVILRL